MSSLPGWLRWLLALGLNCPAFWLVAYLIRSAGQAGLWLGCGSVAGWCLVLFAMGCQVLVLFLIRPLPPVMMAGCRSFFGEQV